MMLISIECNNSCLGTPINNNAKLRASIYSENGKQKELVPASFVSHVIDYSQLLVQRLMAESFKVCVSLKKKDSGETVHFKQDGQRFEKPLTVKLNQNTEYVVRVCFRPETKLIGVLIQGEKYEFEQEAQEKKTTDDDISTYKLTFDTTGYETKAKEKRKNIIFTFELFLGVFMTAEIQCKFYNQSETNHCKWGQPLTWVEYECHVTDGSTHVDVVREKYL